MPPFRRSAYLLAALAVCAFVVSLVWHPAPPAPFVGIKGDEVPVRMGNFVSQGDYVVSADVKVALSSAEMVSRIYAENGAGGGPQLDFVLIGGTDRSALHDPRSCLIGAGWKLENDHTEPVPGAPGVNLRSCRAVGGTLGDGTKTTGYDIVYLYVVDGQIKNEVTQIRGEMLISALLGRKNRPVYFLRLLTPLAEGDEAQKTDHDRLLRFAGEVWKALSPRLIPPAAP